MLYNYELKNAPGKSIVGLELIHPPNGFTPPHRHAGVTVVATVNEGSVLSGMNDNPPKIYNVGESFIEFPGCHHTVGENNSKTAPARLTAVFVVDSKVIENGFAGLIVIDEE